MLETVRWLHLQDLHLSNVSHSSIDQRLLHPASPFLPPDFLILLPLISMDADISLIDINIILV